MSMQTEMDPRFDLGFQYRLRRALDYSGVGVGEMADYLEVSRNTVGNWINGNAAPRPRDLKRFALKTGFPIGWLQTGESDPAGPDDGSHLRESNSRPIHYKSATSHPLGQLIAFPVPEADDLQEAS